MAYLGNQPALSYTSFAKQDFTTSATTSYTLDNPVANANELALFINFVRQEPTTAYTASGTSLTLTSATSASDDMYCVFLGKAVQTVNPPNGSVGSSQIAASIITGQTALGATPADTDELLISDAGTLKRVDFSHLKQANTPTFLGLRSTTQSLAASSTVTITYDSEDVDTDSAFNIATGIFTVPSGKEGTYFFVGSITTAADMGAGEILSLSLNGSDSNDEYGLRIDTLNSRVVGTISGMKYMDVGDTMKFEVDNGTNGSTSNIAYARFGGFRLIGA
jgi:hypothetical protein